MILRAGDPPIALPHSPVRVAFGPGRLAELGTLTASE